jgi:hypothetical protein
VQYGSAAKLGKLKGVLILVSIGRTFKEAADI